MTAQSGLVILATLCHSHLSSQGGINDTCYENLLVCVCIYEFEHNHAIRPGHPSHSMPLAVNLGGSMILVTNVCVCVCVCVCMKLNITTQSGPVILVILCHSR